jgi:hypothetical protein
MVIESAPRTSAAPQSLRRRILFVGEAVTLAHIVRPVVLAQALDPAQYAITLACDDRYLKLFGELPWAWRRSRRWRPGRRLRQVIHSWDTGRVFGENSYRSERPYKNSPLPVGEGLGVRAFFQCVSPPEAVQKCL